MTSLLSAHHHHDISYRKKRIRYQSWHRGCKETDLLLGRFADAMLEQLTEPHLSQFEALLEEEDYDLYRWLTHASPVPAIKQTELFDMLLQFTYQLRP